MIGQSCRVNSRCGDCRQRLSNIVLGEASAAICTRFITEIGFGPIETVSDDVSGGTIPPQLYKYVSII